MTQPLTLREDPQTTRDLTDRAMTIRAATLDEAARSVEVVMTSETPVMVYDWDRGQVIEEVLVADGAQMPSQMPMLECHARYSLDSVLGSVRGIRREGQGWVGRLFFASGDERAESAWNKVKQGHLTDVSVGYRAAEFIDIPAGQKATVGGREFTAGAQRGLRVTTKYDVRECSLVPIGADRNTKVRGGGPPHNTEPAKVGKESVMNPLLRSYLVSLGMRADASDEQAKAFLAALGDVQRAIADEITVGKIADQAGLTARTAPRAAVTAAAVATVGAVAQGQTPEQIRAEAIRQENERQTQIRDLGRDMPPELLQRALTERGDNGQLWTVERAGAEFLRHMQGNRTTAVTNGVAQVNVGADQTRMMGQLALAAALVGGGAARHAPQFATSVIEGDPYRDMRSADAWNNAVRQGSRHAGLGARDFLRRALDLAGVRWDLGDSPGTLLRAAVSGGAVSQIFTTSAYAMMLMAWEETPDSTMGWVSEGEVQNFLTHTEIDFQTDAQLKRHARGGTAPHSSVSDSGNTFKLVRYSKQFSVDEQDIIDDRFGALLTAPVEHGRAARRLRPQLVYSLINQNPTFGGGALFNSTALTTATGHANLGSTVLGAAGLKAAVNLMTQQYLLQGKVRVPLNIRPETLIVPSVLQWTAKELLNSVTVVLSGSTDVERGTKNVLENAVSRLVVDDSVGTVGTWDPASEVTRAGSDTSYYLASGPGRTIEVSYRRGTGRAPQLRSRILEGGQWGIGWDINYDIEAHVKDFRGLVKGNA